MISIGYLFSFKFMKDYFPTIKFTKIEKSLDNCRNKSVKRISQRNRAI